ncbi:NUDIX domain-containing protein [Thermodesulfobacteriota bacterium]
MVEYIDIVNENNIVLGPGERNQVHEKRLHHRSVHIFLSNSKGELFIQKRAKTKKEHPGKYDSSAAGHVDAGEDYDSAAHRELEEELRIRTELTYVAKIDASTETDNEFIHFYTALSDDEISIDRHEIDDGFFLTISEINRLINSDKSAFTPAFLLLFKIFTKNIKLK